MLEPERNRRFNSILENHKGIFFKIARTYCKSDDDRQDLIQEICIQVWRSLHKYDEQFKLSTWLYRIALNVAISWYRKNSNRTDQTVPLNENIQDVADIRNTENETQHRQLEKFIQELNQLDKALMLLYLEDKSHAEISEILGMTVSNVGTKVGRIKEKLKARFLQQKNINQ